ncbi:MAG: hypothetical protein P8010_13390 [Desulfosarcinaceae bacterium]|jgi:hypothetical protein
MHELKNYNLFFTQSPAQNQSLSPIPQRTGVTRTSAAMRHPDLFGDNALHMVNGAAIPDGFKKRIGEAKGLKVLFSRYCRPFPGRGHRFIAENQKKTSRFSKK